MWGPGSRDLGGHLTILARELGYRVGLLGGGEGSFQAKRLAHPRPQGEAAWSVLVTSELLWR